MIILKMIDTGKHLTEYLQQYDYLNTLRIFTLQNHGPNEYLYGQHYCFNKY